MAVTIEKMESDGVCIGTAMENLTMGFVWQDTEQGFDYWRNVYVNLGKLLDAANEEPGHAPDAQAG